MGKFLVVHPKLPSPLTIEEATPIGQKVKANSTLDAYWVKTWGQMNEEGKVVWMLCEWNAVNAEAVRKVLAKIPELPVDGIYPMAIMDSEDFR